MHHMRGILFLHFSCVRILLVTQPLSGNVYRPFIGRSAGNKGYTGQGMQTVRCMRNLQKPLWTSLSSKWLI